VLHLQLLDSHVGQVVAIGSRKVGGVIATVGAASSVASAAGAASSTTSASAAASTTASVVTYKENNKQLRLAHV